MKERPILFSAPMVRAILTGQKTQTRRVVKPQPAMLCRYEMNGAGTHALHLGPPIAPGQTMSFVPPTPRSKDHLLPCPYGAPGDRLWVRESFWCNNETCDHEMCGGCDLGSLMGLGPPYAHVQYVATPECSDLPKCTDAETVKPYTGAPTHGDWWLSPPDGWDGESDYSGRGVWEFAPTHYFTKHPSIHMPRWASRIDLEVTGVRVERLHAITDADARAEGVDWAAPQPYGECWDDDREDPREVGYNPAGASFARDNFRRLWDSINGKPHPLLNDDDEPVRDDNERPIMVAPKSWDANPWVWVVEFRRLEAAARAA